MEAVIAKPMPDRLARCYHCSSRPAVRLPFQELEAPDLFCSTECAAKQGYQGALLREYQWCQVCEVYFRKADQSNAPIHDRCHINLLVEEVRRGLAVDRV